jgi:hypothetical protein
LDLTGLDPQGFPSGLFSDTSGGGEAGNIAIRGQQINLSNGGTIAASSSGKGDAGNIVIQAGTLFRSRNGAVTTEAAQADGGNIQLTATSRVELHDSQISATVQGGAGKGGNITIDPQATVLQRSQIRADAFGGPGGNVRLVTEVFLADPASQVSASSALNIPGTVNIQAAVTNLRELVAPLAPNFARATELLRDRCAARLREGTVSTFVVRGRDGVPAHPGGVLPQPLALAPPEAAVEGLERPNTGDRYLRGMQAQALRWETRDMDCARWRGMPGTDGKTVP